VLADEVSGLGSQFRYSGHERSKRQSRIIVEGNQAQMERQMTKTKAKMMTVALKVLENKYRASDDAAERACAETVRQINVSLPDYSKERLYDILNAQ
jgi:hypothetical protein